MVTNLTGETKWRLIAQGNSTAQVYRTEKKTIHIPIPPIEIFPRLTNTACAIFVSTSTNRKPTWKYGGIAIIKFNSGINNNAQFSITQKKLFLDTTNLVIIPRVANRFTITLIPPYWLWDYRYTIWEYIGDSPADIYSKIDTISQKSE